MPLLDSGGGATLAPRLCTFAPSGLAYNFVGRQSRQLKNGEAEMLRSKQPEVAVTNGRDALRRVRLRNDDARVVETGKLSP